MIDQYESLRLVAGNMKATTRRLEFGLMPREPSDSCEIRPLLLLLSVNDPTLTCCGCCMSLEDRIRDKLAKPLRSSVIRSCLAAIYWHCLHSLEIPDPRQELKAARTQSIMIAIVSSFCEMMRGYICKCVPDLQESCACSNARIST